MSAAGSNYFAAAPLIAVGDTSNPTPGASFNNEPREPVPADYGPVYRSAWWKIVPSANGWIEVDSSGSTSNNAQGPDTVLTIWAGTSLSALQQVAMDDDAGTGNTSKLEFYGYAETTYYAQLGDYAAGNVGTYVLQLKAGVSTGPAPGPPPAGPSRSGTMGSNSFYDAPLLPYKSIADATPSGPLTVEANEPSPYYTRSAWWKFTVPVAETVNIDVLQTPIPAGADPTDYDTVIFVYTGDDPNNLIQIAGGYDNGRRNPDGTYPYGYLTEMNFEAEPEVTYYIYVASYSGVPDMDYVLRVSHLVITYSDWVQPPETTSVFAGNSSYTVQASPAALGSYTGYWGYMSGYQGYKKLSRSGGGITPGTDPPAADCCWTHARRSGPSTGFSWWSINGGYSWNGTDPYQPAVPGYGTCPTIRSTPIGSSWTYNDYPVGYSYTSTDFSLGYQDIIFRVYAQSLWLNLHSAVQIIGPSGIFGVSLSQAPWAPPPYTEVEWESNTATVAALAVQPYEPTAQGNGALVPVNWSYSAACVDAEGTAAAIRFGTYGATQWGPRWRGASAEEYWMGAPEGPEDFDTQTASDVFYTGTREQPLAVGWMGAVTGWTTVDPTTLDKAWAAETELSKTAPDYVKGGLRFVSIPSKSLLDAKPDEFTPYYNKDNQGTHYNYRNLGRIACQIAVRPPRWRNVYRALDMEIDDGNGDGDGDFISSPWRFVVTPFGPLGPLAPFDPADFGGLGGLTDLPSLDLCPDSLDEDFDREDPSVHFPDPTVPDPPDLLTALASDAAAACTWGPPGYDGGRPVTAYEIQATSSVDQVMVTITDVLAFLGTVGPLQNGVEYTVVVRALNEVGWSRNSNELKVTPMYGLPPVAPYPGQLPPLVPSLTPQPILYAFPPQHLFRPPNWLLTPAQAAEEEAADAQRGDSGA